MNVRLSFWAEAYKTCGKNSSLAVRLEINEMKHWVHLLACEAIETFFL